MNMNNYSVQHIVFSLEKKNTIPTVVFIQCIKSSFLFQFLFIVHPICI